jgi:hypothetical protein
LWAAVDRLRTVRAADFPRWPDWCFLPLQGAYAILSGRGDLPSHLPYRPPEWSVYSETPGRTWPGRALHGFWAHREWEEGDGAEELRLVLDTAEAPRLALVCPLPAAQALHAKEGGNLRLQVLYMGAGFLHNDFDVQFASTNVVLSVSKVRPWD